MNVKNYLWILPFLSFVMGYAVMSHLLRAPQTITPHVVGKYVHEVLPLITEHNLNMRLITHKEESTLPEGIILNQTPAAGTAIKSNQPLFIVTTKKPLTSQAPHCVGMHIDEVTSSLQTNGIHPRIYYLSHAYPEKICFAQSPHADEPLDHHRLTLYVSSGNNRPIIWPDFTHMPLHYVVEFLHSYNIQPHIINDAVNHHHLYNDDYTVIDQRPVAGTLLTLDEHKPLAVQLRVH
jgi:beta-lactam-binding protein with PASTA domain